MIRKKLISLFPVFLVAILLLSCGNNNPSTEPVEEVDPATAYLEELSKDDLIPYETCKQIKQDIEQELSDIGLFVEPMTLYVMDGDDSESISIHIAWAGMALAVQFPDYVNASIIHINEVAEKYNLTVSDYFVAFSRGEGEGITWHSTDGVSGEVFDSYGADAVSAVSFKNQTISDLVARYGCTNEFYDLSEYGGLD